MLLKHKTTIVEFEDNRLQPPRYTTTAKLFEAIMLEINGGLVRLQKQWPSLKDYFSIKLSAA